VTGGHRTALRSALASAVLAAAIPLAAQTATEPSYHQVLAGWAAAGVRAASGITVEIPATAWSAASPGAVRAETGIGGRAESVLAWEPEDTWVEYTFSVPRDALYTIGFEYYPLPGRRGPVQRELRLDGARPFREARSLELPRMWADESAPKKDNQGNDLRPRQVETPFWRLQPLEDSVGLAREPLAFHLTAGRHVLRLVALKEPVALARIRIGSPLTPPPYAELRAAYERGDRTAAPEVLVKFQAERPTWKTDPTLRMESSPELRTEPPAGNRRILNVFGSWRWRNGNQGATWTFSVPESGLYSIAMKVSVPLAFTDGLPSVRSVAIDGAIPCRELEEVLFPSGRGAQLITLGGTETPYQFWLARGTHTLELRVTMGPVRSVIETLEGVVEETSRLQRKVALLTGVNPDPNREWDDLPTRIPDMLPGLRRMAEALRRERDVLVALSGGGRPPGANALAMASTQFLSLADKPQTIPSRMGDISSTVAGLAQWLLDMKSQPLEIDWFAVMSPRTRLPPVRAGLLERIAAAWNIFLSSFREDTSEVGSVWGGGAGPVLQVWVARPREYAEIIKDLAEEDFTAETGIRVNVNVIPVEQSQAILLNALLGTSPDVALGLRADLPVNLGVRGALADLGSLPSYPEVTGVFRPGALVPYHYEGKDYGLPETQSFSMLFYRTDILEELHLSVPQTWDDVYAMLPELQKNGLNFYYSGVASVPGQVSPGLLPFLLQRGGTFYNAAGMSGLDTPEAYAAFRQWTELYTNWKLPQQAFFYQHFRTGESPIGVSDYLDYVRFSTAAPELAGRWEMAPIPGIRRPDGTIDRSAGGAGQTDVIFSASKNIAAAWRFVTWWASTPVQVRYGEELEALLGVQARWNTANVDALRSLPWPNKDIQAVLAQWAWFKEQPIVLGGYFTDRHVQNAWNRVVLNGESPREALEIAVEDINRELARKQEEFGGHPDLPRVNGLSPAREAEILGGSP
jgi:ABC-type glycerol-3-phosphate transport system substrate-binding protein